MSRARLGLYIFGRQSVFENCYELIPTMKQLLQKPTNLQLVQDEEYMVEENNSGTHGREIKDEKLNDEMVFNVSGLEHMGLIVSSLIESKNNSNQMIEEIQDQD